MKIKDLPKACPVVKFVSTTGVERPREKLDKYLKL